MCDLGLQHQDNFTILKLSQVLHLRHQVKQNSAHFGFMIYLTLYK